MPRQDIIDLDDATVLGEGSILPPSLLSFYSDLGDRILWLDHDIEEDDIEYVKYILLWNREDVGVPVAKRIPIRLMLFTNGGDLDVCRAVMDAIRASKTPVYGYNMGKAYSAGAFIFLVCHQRFALPTSKFMLHKGHLGLQGTVDEVSVAMQQESADQEALVDMVVEHSNLPRDLVKRRIGTDWYIDAVDACAVYGMVDELITDFDGMMG